MKVYVIKYTLEILTAELNLKYDDRVESFTDTISLLERVIHLRKVNYCTNLKVYSGIANEVTIEAVINPF